MDSSSCTATFSITLYVPQCSVLFYAYLTYDLGIPDINRFSHIYQLAAMQLGWLKSAQYSIAKRGTLRVCRYTPASSA